MTIEVVFCININMLSQNILEICANIDIPSQTIWGIVILLLLLGGAFVAVVLIRRFFSTNRKKSQSLPTFTLESIKEMYDNGQINEDEYKHLRDKIIKQTSF